MNASVTSELLAGLSVEDLTSLSSLSTKALELEAGRLAVQSQRLHFQALGVGDATAIDKASAAVDAGETLIDKELASVPHLAEPLGKIRELAKRAHDPESAKLLQSVRSELASAATADAAEKTPAKPIEPEKLANEVEGQGPMAALNMRYDPKAIPESVASKYRVKGKDFVNPRDSKVAFVDHGSRLQTNKSFDGYAVQSMVAIAEARGWDSIKVSGDEAFRRAVWFEAASRGIAVNGYKPTDAERKSAVSLAERNGRLNKIEENPAAKTFLDARDSASRYSAAKAHPELKQAFALEAALTKFAEQRLRPSDRDAFISQQRNNIAKDLAQGNELPAVSIRANRTQLRQHEQQAEQGR